ncbi:hypothetical protein V6N13_074190 [Hibiscus sabdariffa]
MRFLLWLAWCWFVTPPPPPRSVDAWCGQLRLHCHELPGSAGIPTPLAALVADFGDAGFRCRFPCDALWLFHSHARLVSVGVSKFLAALMLTDFGRRLLILSFANLLRPLAEILSCFLLPSWLCFGGSLHPLPCLAPGLGMVRFLGRFGLAPLRLVHMPPTMCRPCSVPRSLATHAPRGAMPRPPVLSVSALPRHPALRALSLVVPATWGALPKPSVLSMAPMLLRPLVLARARPLPWLATSGPSVGSGCRSLVFKF